MEPSTKPTNEDEIYTGGGSGGHLLSLDYPTGWFIQLAALVFELITSSFLSFISPLICLVQESHAVPRRFLSSLRRALFGFVGALSAMAILVAVMLVSVLIGVVIVRVWVDEPVKMEEVIYFDYTLKEPSAVIGLGGRTRRHGRVPLPPGHSVVVVLDLILPESEYNRRLGMFQITAEAISRNGEIQAASSQPCMLPYRSLPIRLFHTFFMCLPILLGIRSETQKLSIEILRFTESESKSCRTNIISVKLKPRAGLADLPQLYTSEVKIRTQLPWMKQIVYNWKWTLYVWTVFYVYGFILILIVCYLKPDVFGLMLRLRGKSLRASELEREKKKETTEERGELAERLSKWRERVNQRRRRIEHRRVSGSVEEA